MDFLYIPKWTMMAKYKIHTFYS